MWKARYIESRPDAVDRAMSSAGVVRTSIGKLMFSPDASIHRRTSRSASRPASRGHGVLHLPEDHVARGGEHLVRHVGVGPLGQRPSGELVDPRDPAEARALPTLLARPKTVLDRKSSSSQRRNLPSGAGVVDGAVVLLGQDPLGVREPVELEVVVVGGELVEPPERLAPDHRELVGLEGEQRLDPEGERGEDAQCAEADPGDREDVGVLGPRRPQHLAGAGRPARARRSGRSARRRRRRCRGCRWRWRLRRSARRCRPCCAATVRRPRGWR